MSDHCETCGERKIQCNTCRQGYDDCACELPTYVPCPQCKPYLHLMATRAMGVRL